MKGSAFEQAVSNLRGKVGEVGNKTRNVFMDIVSKPFQAVGTKIAEALPYDYPYRVATLSDKLQQAIKFNVPYREQPNATEKAQMNIYRRATPISKIGINAILGEGSDEYTPTMTPSAEMLPYFRGRPETALGQAVKQATLQKMGIHPGVQQYFENIPISEVDYPEKNIAGLAFNVPSGQRYNTFRPRMSSRFTEQVNRHEFLHQAVNVFGVKKLSNFVNSLTEAYKKSPQKYRPIINWIQQYGEDMPEYLRDPNNMANELFAQVGAIYGPSILDDPDLASYYKSVFERKRK